MKQIIFSLLVLMLFMFGVSLASATTLYDFKKPADEYVISQVGQEYFTKYFEYLGDKPYPEDIPDSNSRIVRYAHKISVGDYSKNINVTVWFYFKDGIWNIGQDGFDIKSDELPNCISDKNKCMPFEITKERAIEIAKENGAFDGAKRYTVDIHYFYGNVQSYVWDVTTFKSTLSGKTAIIDLNTGNLISIGNWDPIFTKPDYKDAIPVETEQGLVNAQISEYPQITDQWCDAKKSCPEGLECFSFPGIGLRCAEPNPCSYFKCPKETQCVILESYPAQVTCNCIGPECPAASGDEKTASYDLVTQAEIQAIDQNEQPVSQNISLWKTTPGNKGILQTPFVSVKHSNELIIEESKLFMKTSAGKEPISVMPEAAIAVSETPNAESIQKIELKEESQKPIYYIEGVKAARILFVFPVNLKIETKVDAETGKVISVKKPWYSFLAW